CAYYGRANQATELHFGRRQRREIATRRGKATQLCRKHAHCRAQFTTHAGLFDRTLKEPLLVDEELCDDRPEHTKYGERDQQLYQRDATPNAVSHRSRHGTMVSYLSGLVRRGIVTVTKIVLMFRPSTTLQDSVTPRVVLLPL